MKWTKAQRAAIEARNKNLLVSAAAGAGKTSVLVERIISRICDPSEPVDVDRLLVVTYTKAAAVEMRERIAAALISRLKREGGQGPLRRQLRLLNTATITTVHSFCLDVLRQNFHLLDLDPSFRVANEPESSLLKEEVGEKLFEKYYESRDNKLFTSLVDAYGGTREDFPLLQLVIRLFDFSRSTANPERWLAGLVENFRTENFSVDDFPWIFDLKRALKVEIEGLVKDLEAALYITGLPGGPESYRENLQEDLDLLNELRKSCQGKWDEIYGAFTGAEFSKLNSCREKEADPELRDKVRSLRDGVRKSIKNITNTYFFRTPEEALSDLRNIGPKMNTLVEMVKEFSREFRQAKLERGIVDFGDLEHYTLQILAEEDKEGNIQPSPSAMDYREKFVEVLADEYQDINEVQEAILKLVSRYDHEDPNFFMVGDPKQSIYRFRLAEPRVFQEKLMKFSKTENFRNLSIELRENFRSRRNIIDAVNYVFRQIMTPGLAEINYDQKAQLFYGADYPDGSDPISQSVELHLINMTRDKNKGALLQHDTGIPEEFEEELEAARLEARLIGNRIKELINEKYTVYDQNLGSCRPLIYRDVVILLRATRGWANNFLEELGLMDIPVYAELSSGYFTSTEVETIISLLKVIDNPRQDIPLAAVLRSPVVGLTAGELAEVRLFEKHGDYWKAVLKASRETEKSLAEKLQRFITYLEQWRTKARRGNLAELIWDIYRETGYFDYVGGLSGGTRRQANLRVLHEKAKQFENTSFRGLFSFLRFIDEFRKQGGDLGEAAGIGENENTVRLMSVHKSKGLEFPVVFLAGLGKNFNFQELGNYILLHKQAGLGPEFVDVETGIRFPTLAKLAVQKKLKMETMAEEMRIFYVAMTRAKEKLLLVGSVKNLERAISGWCRCADSRERRLPEAQLSSASNYLDWIAPALIRHPGAGPLREAAGGQAHTTRLETKKDRSSFLVKIMCPGDDMFSSSEVVRKTVNEDEILSKIYNKEIVEKEKCSCGEEVKNVLSWKYPFRKVLGKPAKAAVTELKSRVGEEEQFFDARSVFPEGRHSISARRPKFLKEGRGLSPGEYGTAVHLVMQHLDLSLPVDESSIFRQITDLEERGLLTREQAEAIDVSLITKFFHGSLGRRLLDSKRVLREVQFSLVVPAVQLYEDFPASSKETVLVQGVIDCLFFEDDAAVVVDYKTDNITGQEVARRAAYYCRQLQLYSRAVETILKREVKGRYLYFFIPATSMQI